MLAIVRIALSKPYTFVVMAMLIVIFGVTAAIRTPTDIFPNIGIPVVAVVWTYDGLPADDMSKRVIYYYERTLSSQVNDIEHIESQSLPRYGIVKVFFQPRRQHQRRARSGRPRPRRPCSNTCRRESRRPLFSASTPRACPSSNWRCRANRCRRRSCSTWARISSGLNSPQVAGTAIPSPYGGKILQVQVDIDQQKLEAYGLSAEDVVNAIGQQNIVTPVGTEKVGDFEYVVSLNGSPTRIAELNDAAHSRRQRDDDFPSRCRLRAFRRSAANQHGSRRRLKRRIDDDPEDGAGVDA